MYARLPAFVLGFHGCDQEVAERILADDKTDLAPSENDYDWLGNGRYFWENNHERALQFAQEMKGRQRRHGKPIQHPYAIGAIIDPGHCLNLLDHQGLSLVKTQYEELAAAFAAAGQDLPANKPLRGSKDLVFRRLDRAVIQAIHHKNKTDGLPAYDSVRAVFVEGEQLYPGAGFHGKNHIQLCVVNPKRILGYFRPRKHTHGD